LRFAQFWDDTYPRSPRAVAQFAGRCLRRDVDAHPSFTWQRPAPGRRVRMARDPGGSLRPLPPRRQQWRLCAVTALRAQGVNVRIRATGAGREAKASQRVTNRRHAGALRQPGDPAKVSGSPTGFPGRPAEAFRAGSDPALGCPCGARVPVAPPAPRRGRTARAVRVASRILRMEILSLLQDGRTLRGRPRFPMRGGIRRAAKKKGARLGPP
jgi:hypothetical protein